MKRSLKGFESGTDLMEMDRMLLVLARKNLARIQHLSETLTDEAQKTNLVRFISKHALLPPKKPEESTKPVVSEGARKLSKLARYMQSLTDSEVSVLIEWAKSLHRQHKVRPRASAGEGEEEGRSTTRRKRPAGPLREGESDSTSGSSAGAGANASDSKTGG